MDQALGLQQVIRLEHGGRADAPSAAGLAYRGHAVAGAQGAAVDELGNGVGVAFVALHGQGGVDTGQTDLVTDCVGARLACLAAVGRQWQQIDYGSRYSESYMDSLPNFDKLVESYGHVGITIDKPSDVEGVLKDAFAMKDKLVFMNFITDRDENVWPMVKAGFVIMKHIIAVLLENEPGALSRVVGLFSARGYNIESLTVAPTEDPSLSRMTIQTTGSDDVIEQITKHLNRLIEVVKVVDLTEGAYTERELMMVKVRAVGKEREEMKRMADIFRGRIIDVTEK
eukprot:gene18051-25311_t